MKKYISTFFLPININFHQYVTILHLGLGILWVYAQSLCDPTDCSLPGSSVLGISQARILEWVAISSSRGFPPPSD